MFLDEARLAARIRHPNVVSTLDVVSSDQELFLVMDYVQGDSASRLAAAAREASQAIPLKVISAIMCGTLHGLHAAHEATNERGEPLGIVHRDVSPQNILVGVDGVPRVLDFGVAKASGRARTTRDGHVKGKLAYMAPEQLRGTVVDRRTDVFAAGIVLWELLTGRRLFGGADNEGRIVTNVLEQVVEPPSRAAPGVSPALDAVVLRALSRDQSKRFATARQMALAVEEAVDLASPAQVGAWVETLAGEVLHARARTLADIESGAGTEVPVPSEPSRAPRVLEGTLSQVSTRSLVETDASARGGRRWLRPLWLAVGAVALVTLGVVGGMMRGVHSSAPSSDPAAADRTPEAAAGPTASAPDVRPAAPATGTSAMPSASPSDDSSAPSARPHASPTRAPKTAPSPTSADCDPPYTDTPAGRVYKRECLK
jgi:serine/threonine-protein kinase